MKSKDGTLILDKEQILQRWNEYDKREQPVIYRSIKGQEILKSEVESILTKLNRNKATGPDGIIMERLAVLYDLVLTRL